MHSLETTAKHFTIGLQLLLVTTGTGIKLEVFYIWQQGLEWVGDLYMP
jgi:hypothetical protein